MKKGKPEKLLGFGKYATRTWNKVPAYYLQWLIDNNDDVVTRAKAQAELVHRWSKEAAIKPKK